MARGGAAAIAHAHALDTMETHAIREKQRTTYNATLGSFAFFLFVVLELTLPSPWKVLNGEWSSSILPSLTALGGKQRERSAVPFLSLVWDIYVYMW